MPERTSVVNISGDHEETIIQLARHLGTSKLRRKLFNAVYGRGSKPKSKRQLMKVARLRSRDDQQAQNELNHLANHHLIVREKNDGSVDDGSRNLYQKDPTVRANRAKIVRLADDRAAAEKIPTKRRPQTGVTVTVRTISRQALRHSRRLDVLYLTANPDPENSLRVDAEVRRVQEAIRGSNYRGHISVAYRPAADLNSLIDGLNDLKPGIVHFSGHGYEDGILVDDAAVSSARRPHKIVTFDLLAKALKATDSPPKIVVLNSCKSAGVRKALFPSASAVIVMRDSISDVAAIAFAPRFYAALAAGQSIKSAFAQGKVAVEAASITEANTPELFVASGVNPGKIKLA